MPGRGCNIPLKAESLLVFPSPPVMLFLCCGLYSGFSEESFLIYLYMCDSCFYDPKCIMP